ncbi:hypothetical protein Tco_1329537 [Tanacetum coccineum]
MSPEDEVLPAEEQPLLAASSPTADSPGYVSESDPEEDPEEDDDEDPEEDPADYSADGGNEMMTRMMILILRGMRSKRSTQLLPTLQLLLYQLLILPHLLRRLSHLRPTKVARLLAIPTPPPSPLFSWSSPLPQIPSPPLPVSPPPPASPTYPLGYRAAMIRLRAEAPSTFYSSPLHIILSHTRADTPPSKTPPLLPIPAPISSPSLLLPSTDHRADRPEVGESSSAPAARPSEGFRADYRFVAMMDMEFMWDLERDVGYEITNTWDEMLVDMPRAPATDDTELGRRMTEFATRVKQDTYEIYVRLDDEQTERQLMAGRLNMLHRDRCAHARTTLLTEREAKMSREAWG